MTGSFSQLNVRVTVWNLSRYFSKQTPRFCQRCQTTQRQTQSRKAHWPTGSVCLVTVAIKPDLAAEIREECPCLYVCFVVWTRVRVDVHAGRGESEKQPE